MALPSPDTPLYNHPLPDIEQWLVSQGCERNPDHCHCWYVTRADWKAEICLEIDSIRVRYINAVDGARDVHRMFQYSLSRKDLDEVIFQGP